MAETSDLYSRVFGSTQSDGLTPDREVMALNDSEEAEERAVQVMKNIANSEGPYNAWAGPAKEDNRFYNGHQWDDIDRMAMEQKKRPAVVFNDIKPTLDAVSGLERLNRQDVHVQSRALDSDPMLDAAGDLATAAISTADDISNGAEEDSRVAFNAAVMGMGWGEVKMSYDDDIDGRVMYERLDPFKMRWDPNNQEKENLEGTEWRALKKTISRKKFEQNWPDKIEAIDLAVPMMPYGGTDKYELVTPYYSKANEQANPQINGVPKKDIEIIQYQWRDMQPLYRFVDPQSGEMASMDEDKWKTLKSRSSTLGIAPPAAVKQMQPVYRQGMYCKGVELEEPVDLPGGFSLLCTTGYWDDEKKRWVGIVRSMIDPQKTKNKAISSALAFHISNAKGGVVFKTRLFADPTMAQNKWAQPDAWIEANDDADLTADLLQRQPSQMPQELGMFYSEAKKAISASSGINEALIGTDQGQTPSQTNSHRAQASLVVLGWYFDNLNRHRREKAQTQLEFIREYWSQGQFVQCAGDFDAKSLQLFKEALPERGRYSFVLDDSIRHNPNLKSQVWHDLTESGVLQALMKFGLGRVILKLLKYSPFPSQLVNDINQEVAQNPPQPPQKGKGKQEDPQLTDASVKLKSAQAEKALAQAREIDMRAKLAVPNAIVEGIGQHQKHQVDMLKAAKQKSGFGPPSGFGG